MTGACGVAGVALDAAGRAGGGACAEETTTQLSPMVAAMMSLFIPPKRIPQLCEHQRSGFPAPKPYLTIVDTQDSLGLFTSTWTVFTVRLMVPFTVAFMVPLAARLRTVRGHVAGAWTDDWRPTTDDD